MSLESSIQSSLEFLESPEALASLERDPYWPKWDSPWWRMLLLHEMGLSAKIPAPAVEKLLEVASRHFIQFFPFRENEIPAGVDPYRHIPCHCALGSLYQMLHSCGVDVDAALPWIRPWFLKYQLPDGGLNCDEKAYTRDTPKSSIVSTLPPLESVLYCTKRPLTKAEEQFLDAGAAYLINHRLYRSMKTGGVINEEWLELGFPRFYHYDILRGLLFLAVWSERRRQVIPRRAIEEPLGLMRAKMKGKQLEASRVCHAGGTTMNIDGAGNWLRVDAETFELLDRVSAPMTPNEWLTRDWSRVREILGRGY
ncbi:MAG: hypothetical protein K8T20_16890 [Planctomycetes bacterium]|nr:hypothetical protein [Planctomycetota bacterium]